MSEKPQHVEAAPPTGPKPCRHAASGAGGGRAAVGAEIVPAVRQQKFPAGSPLSLAGLRQGTIATIAVGAVRLESILDDGRRQVLGFRYKGDQLIDLTQVLDLRHIALTECVIYFVNESEWHRCEQCKVDAERSHRAALQDAFERIMAQAILLGRCTATERIATFLLDISSRTGFASRTGVTVALPMKRDDIADYLGLNPETVSRLFSKLKNAGIIDLPKPGRVILLDRKKLTTLSPLPIATPTLAFDAA